MDAQHTIPFFSSPAANAAADVRAALDRVLASGVYLHGREVAAFEDEFAHYVGASHCITTGNGSDALELSLRAVGVQPGNRVVTAANAGFYASTAIHGIGAQPLYAEIDPSTMTLAPSALAAALKQQPRAVVVTHLYGQMADIATLQALSDSAGVPLIEDCAQAHGAVTAGRKAGSWGRIGCFSFYPTKNLGALGDAGAVVTSDDDIADRLKSLRQYGWSQKYTVALPGGRNSRMDELQAAILRVKLKQLDHSNLERRQIARRYNAGLAHTPLRLPLEDEDHVSHLYVVRSPQRDALHAHLQHHGVGCQIHYPIADHRQPAYAHTPISTPGLVETELACQQVLSLPCFPGLAARDIDQVIEHVNEFFEGNAKPC